MTTGAAEGLVGVELVLLDEFEQVLFVSVELESDDEFESLEDVGRAGATRTAVFVGALTQIKLLIYISNKKLLLNAHTSVLRFP